MPRIYTAEGEPVDYCVQCFPGEEVARIVHGDGEGPDGRGDCFEYSAEHPNYDDEEYPCEGCGCQLVERRDG